MLSGVMWCAHIADGGWGTFVRCRVHASPRNSVSMHFAERQRQQQRGGTCGARMHRRRRVLCWACARIWGTPRVHSISSLYTRHTCSRNARGFLVVVAVLVCCCCDSRLADYINFMRCCGFFPSGMCECVSVVLGSHLPCRTAERPPSAPSGGPHRRPLRWSGAQRDRRPRSWARPCLRMEEEE